MANHRVAAVYLFESKYSFLIYINSGVQKGLKKHKGKGGVERQMSLQKCGSKEKLGKVSKPAGKSKFKP